MLINNITDEHAVIIAELNTKFDEKCQTFIENEAFLK
jgi:hypothetical protein